MLKIGDKAPEFVLPDGQGRPVSLGSLLVRGPLLLYFYPADFTRLCTKQACMYRDHGSEIAAAGVQIAGISRQDSSSKARFSEEFGVDFALLADTDGAVTGAYGANLLGGLITRRIAYFIAQDGRVAGRTEANLDIGRHESFLKSCIRQARDAK